MTPLALLLAATMPAPLAGRGALLVVGLALLIAGRKLFWLAVGALGFVAGWEIAAAVAPHLDRTALLVVAALCGIVGLVLAIVVQKVAVALAGFFLGVLLAVRVLAALDLHLGAARGLVIAAAGILVAVGALALFGLALVVLTAGAGAQMLVDAFHPSGALAVLALVALWIVGIIVQRRWSS